ncbi:glycosyltransferase family 2 protein [Salinicoccus roseus]|uniref:glycosyltransferase family 2 protein n=1 Tax=Salinicoccus roseus TaxID=45670 RepID=UPI000F966483|nr:glycosyltransferase family 2 protein [Salinicoccus roseus]RPE54800.1 glycosyl transferase family 2 [Salinicoccus roseus]GGA62538.1 hypothetical protein GCM10007176_03700 [Salinicoccus roseus]
MIDKLSDFRKISGTSLSKKTHSLFNFDWEALTKVVKPLSKTLIYRELALSYGEVDASIDSVDLLILSEPEADVLTEKEMKDFYEQYQRMVDEARSKEVPIIHLVTNPKWFFYFEEMVNEEEIQVYMNEAQYDAMPGNIKLSHTMIIKPFLMPNDFIHYSNEVNKNILVDLTKAPYGGSNYTLKLEKLIKEVMKFDHVYILIKQGDFIPEIEAENITILTEEHRETLIKECTYVFVYTNTPYKATTSDNILYYAANSKVIYTNYNYELNNILPSVILNISQKDYHISIHDRKTAFDIINENRNTVMYHYTLLNVLDEMADSILGERMIKKSRISTALEIFEENPFFTVDALQYDYKVIINDYKYDLEKTMLFPILFMGTEGVSFKDSRAFREESGIEVNIEAYTMEMASGSNEDKVLSIIVPIHNNGKYLKYKCFNSMLSLSCFNQLEIIFVDDGSTDPLTIRMIQDLLKDYPDIVYKHFDEGSGSASRPRNAGVGLASAPLITFLDPDNEAIEDGYTVLLEEMQSDEDIDMVVGNIVREDNLKRNEINYYRKVKKVAASSLVDDTRSTLVKTQLTVQSIQALIVKKKIIDEFNLKMVEGAAGQDTLFFQQLFLRCDKVKVVDHMIHSYYAYVEGSITNTVTHKFFEKFYKVEKERVQFLREQNLIREYMEIKFNFYIRNWYFFKYHQITNKDEKARALTFIQKILGLYSEYEDYFETEVKEWVNIQ